MEMNRKFSTKADVVIVPSAYLLRKSDETLFLFPFLRCKQVFVQRPNSEENKGITARRSQRFHLPCVIT